MPEGGGHVVVVGGGFSGLAAAYELGRRGVRATVVESDEGLGGLAGSFDVGGGRLEKFYHHWFTSDRHVTELVEELGAAGSVVSQSTRTGMYYAGSFFRLGSPLDVLRFTPLGFVDRIRLGLMVLKARRVKDWRELESVGGAAWLRQLGGQAVYDVVWEPLLRGKFGDYAESISAVWFWNKLKLRGGSRGKGGQEVLAYYRGGFAALAEQVAARIRGDGGAIRTGERVTSVIVEGGRACGVETNQGRIEADAVILTTPLPIAGQLLEPHVDEAYAGSLQKIDYLANVCLVLELDRSLSDTYWLNVNDPDFPFVGVIEHTNFEPTESYGGRHIVYLSKYLPVDDPLYTMNDDDVMSFSLPHLQRMFPEFSRDWIHRFHLWRARYAQPIVVRNYSRLIPSVETPLPGAYLATMAQVYPEDRGTNYAIRDGRQAGALAAAAVTATTPQGAGS